jgi:hypothetical protein
LCRPEIVVARRSNVKGCRYCGGRAHSQEVPPKLRPPAVASWGPVMDDDPFQTLIEQVRDLHRRTDELNRSKARRVHDNVRARLSWNAPPSLPADQRNLADEVVTALSTPRLSSAQSRRLWRTYFGK